MLLERITYKKNIEDFSEIVINRRLDKLLISSDSKPDFDSLSFHFDYALNIVFCFESFKVLLLTSMTDKGVETFWFDNKFDKPVEIKKEIKVDSILQSLQFESKNGFDFPYKMTLTFSDKKLFIYCGEIYKTENSNLTYKIYDEMLLLFDNDIDVLNFENRINYG